MKDRRTALRYDLSLPVTVSASNEKKGITHTGQTRDISTRGVYFLIDDDIKSGAESRPQDDTSSRGYRRH